MTRWAGLHGVAGAQRWTPKVLGSTALAVWYDPSDASTVTLTSSKVSQINDKSGNARNATQTTAGNRPVIAAATQNGLDALQFYADSSADWLSVPATGVSAQPFTLYCAVKINNNTKNRTVFMDANDVTFESKSSTNGYVLYAGAELFSPNDKFTSSWSLFGATYNGSSSDIYLNATSIKSGNAGTRVLTGGSRRIGDRTTGPTDQYFDGYLGDFVIISGSLSTVDRQKLEGYLAHKWGVTGSLPSDHPYKNYAP